MEQATQEKYLKISTKIDDAVTELSVIDQKMKEAENNMEKYTQYEEILGVQEPANFQAVLDAREELNLRYHMWKGINEFGNLNKEWAKIPFKDVDAKKIANQTEMYARIVNKCKKNLAENKVLNLLMDPVMAYKATMPVVTALRSKYLTEQHWDEIKQLLKANFDINDENFTLQDLLNLKVSNFQEELIDISVRAAQEDAIKQQLAQIEEQWNGVNVSMKLYKESNDLAVLAEVDEMIQLFDEGLATMNNILASRFVRPMRAQAEKI